MKNIAIYCLVNQKNADQILNQINLLAGLVLKIFKLKTGNAKWKLNNTNINLVEDIE